MPAFMPWVGAAASNWAKACGNWRWRNRPPNTRIASRPRRLSRAHERGHKGSQQVADLADPIFQSMIGVEHVERCLMLAGPADAVFNRHHVIAPAVHDGGGSGDILRRMFFQAGRVEGRRQ